MFSFALSALWTLENLDSWDVRSSNLRFINSRSLEGETFCDFHHFLLEMLGLEYSNLYNGKSVVTFAFYRLLQCKYTFRQIGFESVLSIHVMRNEVINKSYSYRNVNAFTSCVSSSLGNWRSRTRKGQSVSIWTHNMLLTSCTFWGKMSCAKDPEAPDSRKITVWSQWLTAFASKLSVN